MKARVLALGLVLAWPSLAHANWFNDTIGRPITGGLGLGAHLLKDSMVTGAKQTSGAFGSAARGVGLEPSRPDPTPPSEANAGSPPVRSNGAASTSLPAAPPPAGADKMAPNARPDPRSR